MRETYLPAWVWTGQAFIQGKFDSSQSKSTSFVRASATRNSSRSICYLFTTSSTLAPLEVTSTSSDVTLPSSLQVFNV